MNYETEILPKALKDKLQPFKELLAKLENNLSTMGIFEFFNFMIDETKIMDSFDTENEQDYERSLNISALIKTVKDLSYFTGSENTHGN